jgi:hypothetical protein
MTSNWGNLINKRVGVYLSKIADEHLERILNKAITSQLTQIYEQSLIWLLIFLRYGFKHIIHIPYF